MSSTINPDVFPAGFSLTGGIPTKSQDLAASVLFLIAYLLLVPLLVLRLSKRSSRNLVLVRPALFMASRIATYIIRAIQANGNDSEGLFIGEQILLLCGFFLLLEPFTALVKYNLYRDWIPVGKGDWLSTVLLLTRFAVITAVVLGIVVGSQITSAMNDPDLAGKLRRYRWAGAGLALAVIVVTLLLAVGGALTGVSDFRRTTFLGLLGSCLLVASIYKLVSYADPAHPLSPSGKAVFYILFALPELLAVSLYLSINLERNFQIKEGIAKEKWNKKVKKGKASGTYVSPYENEGQTNEGPYEMSENGSRKEQV